VLLKAGDPTLDLPTVADAAVRFRFSLPSGGYATVFVDAILQQ
jgi:tRNA(Glu) U13 pseudouridine synthase TruD